MHVPPQPANTRSFDHRNTLRFFSHSLGRELPLVISPAGRDRHCTLRRQCSLIPLAQPFALSDYCCGTASGDVVLNPIFASLLGRLVRFLNVATSTARMTSCQVLAR